MSVFSVFKRSRQAAKHHAAKEAELKKQEEAKKTPYKHVPKHAALDALSCGPASCREEDRVRIQEENRRRNAMTASGTSTPTYNGLPRAQSMLSTVSYPTMHANPIVHPGTYSYSPAHPSRFQHGAIDVASSRTIKGKRVDRMVDSGRASRASSRASSTRKRVSTGSSDNSISSQDELEMTPVRRNSRRQSDPGRFAVHTRLPIASYGIPPVPPLPEMNFDGAIGTATSSSTVAIDDAVRSTLSSRRASPTLVPETVHEDPSEGEDLDCSEKVPKLKDLRRAPRPRESKRYSTTTSSLLTRFDEASLATPQALALPSQRMMKSPMGNNHMSSMWATKDGQSPVVAY